MAAPFACAPSSRHMKKGGVDVKQGGCQICRRGRALWGPLSLSLARSLGPLVAWIYAHHAKKKKSLSLSVCLHMHLAHYLFLSLYMPMSKPPAAGCPWCW